MGRIGARDLLEVWDRNRHRSACDGAVFLLEMALDQDRDELASMSLDLRNGELLKLRQTLLGPDMEVFDRCPTCRTQVEFEVPLPQLIALIPQAPTQTLIAKSGEYTIRFRPPNSWDLGAVAHLGYSDQGGHQLFKRLVLECHKGQEPIATDDLPEEAKEAVAGQLQEARPLTEIVFTLSCPEPQCTHRWRTTLDIAEFVWREVRTQAQLLLHQVHRLARGYGWTEDEILNLSGPRRRFYLEMLNA